MKPVKNNDVIWHESGAVTINDKDGRTHGFCNCRIYAEHLNNELSAAVAERRNIEIECRRLRSVAEIICNERDKAKEEVNELRAELGILPSQLQAILDKKTIELDQYIHNLIDNINQTIETRDAK